MASPPTAIELVPNTLADVATAKPSPPRPTTPKKPVPPKEADNKDSVFLKQDGKVYLVKDWATLQRWIMENRVGRDDMVSEGGVNWEQVGAKAELGSFFSALEKLEAAEMAGIGLGTEAFAADPPTSEMGALARLDEATEGVPVGLPPLPTEEIFMSGAPEPLEESYPELPPTKQPVDAPSAPELEPEPSTVEDIASSSSEAVVEMVEDTPLPSNVMEFPNLDFEPTINPIDGLDEPEAVSLDANQLPGEETLPPDFGDFGDFNQPNGEGEPNDLEVSPTETDIPKPTPSLDFDEKELFIDPNTIAPPSSSFDDEFGKNFTPEPQDDVELLEADNTEILEEEDPFADFGDFFQDDLASVPPKSSKGNGLKIGIGAGIIVAIGAFGAAYTGVLPMGATQSPDTVTFNNSVSAQPEPEEEVKTPKAQDDDVNAENMETEPEGGDEGNATGDDTEPVDAAESESKPESEQEPEPKPEPKPESKPEPKPVPKPKPQPKPKVAKAKDNTALVDEGWNNVDRGRLKSAITSFAKVLDKNATHAEANYGLGYALIQQGRQQEAKRFLCTSLSKVKNDSSPAGVSTLRDVKGLLKNNQLSCD